MNKGLDLIQRQQIEEIDGYPTGNVYVGLTSEELAELEKELKASEVVGKYLDISFEKTSAGKPIMFVRSKTLGQGWLIHISEEEFNSLKEALS